MYDINGLQTVGAVMSVLTGPNWHQFAQFYDDTTVFTYHLPPDIANLFCGTPDLSIDIQHKFRVPTVRIDPRNGISEYYLSWPWPSMTKPQGCFRLLPSDILLQVIHHFFHNHESWKARGWTDVRK